LSLVERLERDELRAHGLLPPHETDHLFVLGDIEALLRIPEAVVSNLDEWQRPEHSPDAMSFFHDFYFIADMAARRDQRKTDIPFQAV
jgi:hypothetical protein